MLYLYVKEFDVASSSLMTVTSSWNETGGIAKHLSQTSFETSYQPLKQFSPPGNPFQIKAPLNLSIA